MNRRGYLLTGIGYVGLAISVAGMYLIHSGHRATGIALDALGVIVLIGAFAVAIADLVRVKDPK